MRTMIVTGTGTGVGKTVVTAAVAALAHAAGERVVVVKPAQTGLGADEPGDLADVTRLSGVTRTLELARYPDPLAPATAARRVGAPVLTAAAVVEGVVAAAHGADLVLVEGAGGLLVRLNDGVGLVRVSPTAAGPTNADRGGAGESLADVAVGLRAAGVDAEVLLVAWAGLGVLNAAALTAEALRARGVPLAGTVVGAWPAEPDLAERCNLDDLPVVTGAPLLGVLPDGLGAAAPDRFLAAARCGLGPVLGGGWSVTGSP